MAERRWPVMVAGLWPSRRAFAFDAAVAAVVTGLNEFQAVFAPPGILEPSRGVSVAVTAAAGAALLLRRRFPLPVALVAVAADTAGRAFLVELVALYTVASFAQSRREQMQTLSLALLAGVLIAATSQAQGVGALAGQIVIKVAAPVAVGFYVATRRARTESFRVRTARLEQERDLLAARARAEERSRIAREMHDVVAHRLSLMVLHAGGLEVQGAKTPSQVVETASLIRSIGQQALEELRQVVAVLRVAPEGAPPLAPQPTLEDLDALLENSRAAGIEVRLDVEGARVTLDQPVERAVYRLVQEALTNVHKHGCGASAEVHLQFADHAIEVSVSNALPPAWDRTPSSTGSGLLGLRERVELVGGSFSAGPRSNGRFEVAARLPLAPGRARP